MRALTVREQETGFGVGQQMNSEGGTRKAGVDGRYRLTERMVLEGEAYRQEVLTRARSATLVSAEVRREADDYTLGVGARHVEDASATECRAGRLARRRVAAGVRRTAASICSKT